MDRAERWEPVDSWRLRATGLLDIPQLLLRALLGLIWKGIIPSSSELSEAFLGIEDLPDPKFDGKLRENSGEP